MIINKLKYAILSVTLASGIISAAAGFSMGAVDDYVKLLNLTDIESVVESYGVAGLNIDVDYADVEITASNEASDFEITASNISRGYLKYSVSNNIFSLKYSFNKWYEVSSVPILLKDAGKIKITVPAEMSLQDVQIKSGTNKVSVNYLKAENIYIDGGNRDNFYSSITADHIEIKSGSGNVNAQNLSSDTFIFCGGSGKADIMNFQTKQAEIQSKTGNISLSGSIKENSVFTSGWGDINADIFGNIKDYSVKLKKGKAVVNGSEVTHTGSGKNKMDISAGTGDVNISFK